MLNIVLEMRILTSPSFTKPDLLAHKDFSVHVMDVANCDADRMINIYQLKLEKYGKRNNA